ncbi:unnamed protein product [Merluccius merluccius]
MDPGSRVVVLVDQVQTLEDQVQTLAGELTQCQADKEFVWSLWKRLQVANPDLTQAVSLVVEREKQKAEMKDRKVLEILQTKDYKIQELEQRVMVQQQEVNHVQQRKMVMGEERAALNKEVSALHEKLANSSQEIKEMRAQHARSEEEAAGAMRALEEQKEEWASRCSGLQADLEEQRRRATRHEDQREATQARIKELEGELGSVLPQWSSLQSQSSSLAALLSAKDKEMAAQEEHLNRLRGEVAEVQALYRQSTEHAAEQSHLIKQLEGLNLDTHRVLRNQEEAHSVDATSYQRLYTELSQSYQALVASETLLRQNHLELSGQLAQRDQQVLELSGLLAQREQQVLELQNQHLLQTQQQQQAQQTTITTTTTAATGPQPNKQTNVKELSDPRADGPVWTPSSGFDQAWNSSGPEPGTSTPLDRGTWAERTSEAGSRGLLSASSRRQDAPVQRSRSLSPASCVKMGGGEGGGKRGGGGGGGGGEQRMRDLEELLQLKTKEMEVLRSAHENRLKRLHLIQANYRTIRDQLKDAEEANGLAEASRHASAIRALRAQVQEKEDDLRALQDKVSHSERRVVMERQLVENLRSRLQVLQAGEKGHRGQVEELETKVRSQSEEATNRKAFIESLKRRLSVATSEKSEHKTSCTKLREELDRKERLLETLQAQVGAGQRSLAQLEQTATGQMESLAQQSSQALDVLQRRLGLASSQTEQLHAFINALAGEILRDIVEVKQRLTETRRSQRRRRCEEADARGGPAAKSMIRAKSIAASILNMSERDLADMLDGDQDTEPSVEVPDQVWLQHLRHILQQKTEQVASSRFALCFVFDEKPPGSLQRAEGYSPPVSSPLSSRLQRGLAMQNICGGKPPGLSPPM